VPSKKADQLMGIAEVEALSGGQMLDAASPWSFGFGWRARLIRLTPEGNQERIFAAAPHDV